MKKRLTAICLLIVMLTGSIYFPAEAASMKIAYNGKTVTYSGKQIKVVVNGKSKSISATPGILMGSAGYAMLPYYETFVTSDLKMKKTYYSSSKKLVLTYNSQSLIMTVNKTQATMDGKTVTLPVAPVSVTYKNSGKTRILVPARKVAELFGLDYNWNSATATVSIAATEVSASTAGVAKKTSPTYYYKGGKKYKFSKRNVYYNGTKIDLTTTPACVIDNYNYIPYKNALVKNGPKITSSYVSSSKKLTLTSTVGGNKNVLVMKINSKKATLNGKAVTLPKAPIYLKMTKKGSNVIYVPAKIVGTLLGLEYSYTKSSKKISYTPGLSIKQNGNYSVYTRTQVQVKANEKEVTSKIPGLLESNTTLIPASATFNSKYGLGVTYSYSGGKATFKRGDITVVTTKNSKIAKVNGESKTMPVPMRMTMLTSNGTNYVMVPGEFITETLGLSYQYAGGVSSISGKVVEETPDADSTPGDSDDGFLATITMTRPEEVTAGNITCSDDYENRRLIITMQGNHTSYYSSHKPKMPSGVTFSTKYTSSSNKTKIYLTTKTINGFRVKEDSKNIYIMNGAPKNIFSRVVVLDAGHGGSDSGAVGNGYYEKDFTLSIVKAAKTYFDSNGNYKVYYTRLDDTYPSLSERYKLANEVQADIFLSVHINSAGSTATGTETLYNPDRNKKNSAGLTCYQLANFTQKRVQAATGFKNRGIKQRCSRLGNGLAVLNNNNGPATLTEIGFISNKTEAKKMAANLSSYGQAIYQAIVDAS